MNSYQRVYCFACQLDELLGTEVATPVCTMNFQRQCTGCMNPQAMLFCSLLLLLYSVSGCQGDKVHCYCNSPRCVGYSYMCVSEYGCFSQLATDSSYLKGCVQDVMMIERCLEAEENTIKRLNKSLIRAEENIDLGIPLLSCCYDDMCNYANYNQQDQRSSYNADHEQHMNEEMTSLNSKAVWFRAAVIAVPIAGVCILILLAMLASRLLSNDSNKESFSPLNNQRLPYPHKRTHAGPCHGQPYMQQKRSLYLNSRVPINDNYSLRGGGIRSSLPADVEQDHLRFARTFAESDGLLTGSLGAVEGQFGLPKCANNSQFLSHQHIKATQFYPARTDKLQIV